jgi:hypothetical protein
MEEVGNFEDLAHFDQVPHSKQVPPRQQVPQFDRSAYKGPLGIDLAMDTSNLGEELRSSRIDFVARYYREPTTAFVTGGPKVGLTWFENCRSLGAELAGP